MEAENNNTLLYIETKLFMSEGDSGGIDHTSLCFPSLVHYRN